MLNIINFKSYDNVNCSPNKQVLINPMTSRTSLSDKYTYVNIHIRYMNIFD